MEQRKHIQTQSEWEGEMSKRILDFVQSELYLDLPFMGIALGALEPSAKEEIDTFATDGVFLYFSSEQILRVFRSNPKFLDRSYLHSILHCMFAHLWIGGERERDLWGIACDIAVEYTIDRMDKPCTRRILGWIRQKTYAKLEQEGRGISAATVYLWLREKTFEEQESLMREFYTDDHRFWPKQEQATASGGQEAQKRWSSISRQTGMEQKRRGEEPKDGEEVLSTQLAAAKSRRSYREFLRKFSVLREELRCDPDEFDLNYYTYGLRLYRNMPLIEPLESREEKRIQEFVVVVDTSYSTSGELIQSFLRETFTILAESNSFFHRSRIHILQCDDKVRKDEVISSEAQLEAFFRDFEVVGGGGTDFRPAFSYVNRLIEEGAMKHLSGLLYFTDGKGIYPEKRPQYKTAFLFLEDYDDTRIPAWAIRMRMDPVEFQKVGKG